MTEPHGQIAYKVRRTRCKVDVALIAVAGLWLLMAAVMFSYVNRYAIDMPLWDEVTLAPQMLGEEPIDLRWIFAQHNEHRIPLAKVTYVGVSRVFGNSFRAPAFANAAALALAAGALILLARRVRGHTSWFDLSIPVLMLGLGHNENLLPGFQLAFSLSVLVFCLALLAMAGPGEQLTVRRIVGIAVGILLLQMCAGTGLVLSIPLIGWLAAAGVVAVRRGGPAAQGTGFTAMAAAVVCAAATGTYLLTQQPPPRALAPDVPITVETVSRGAAEFLGVAFGPYAAMHWPTLCFAAALLVLAGALLVLMRPMGSTGPPPLRRLALAAGLVAVLVSALAVGYSRGFLSPGAGRTPRYFTIAAMLLVLSLPAFSTCGGKFMRRVVPLLLLAAVIPLARLDYQPARQYGRHRVDFFKTLHQEAQAGIPPVVLSERYHPHIFPNESKSAEILALLERHRAGPYRHLRNEQSTGR